MRIYAYKTVKTVEIYGRDINETLIDQINYKLKQVWVKEANIVDCPTYTIEDIEDVWRAHCYFIGISSTFVDVEVTLRHCWNTDETYKTSMYEYLINFLEDVLDDNWINNKWTATESIEYDYEEEIR